MSIFSNLMQASNRIQHPRFNQQVADDLVLQWIIHANLPFRITSDERFQTFIYYLHNTCAVPRSPNTIRKRILVRSNQQKLKLAELLRESMSQIHISCDGWTSPHHTMAILGIIAHFTPQSCVQMNPVLGLRLLEGSHTGATMVEVVTEVLQSYGTGVEEKFGFVVRDNASNNDRLVRALSDDQVFSNQSGLYDA
jgi:hypothetical protein